ncbi:brefeldin A-inhibited guanine nucleotide-exchange protein 2-like [Planoprotostelium fungivorum]|uniref:Brefeldin A-inhibited guanine nucleotide-exchange protein 2-like n=1 Tax=Planoprotostelium fungivorum TaxID=1890364 RepID=A0A2P6N545_9EUKA|nr:brefeldin A-inhibited guanine nucleotide-exchange protein 2-like [Planoprotostelium fungivorum]
MTEAIATEAPHIRIQQGINRLIKEVPRKSAQLKTQLQTAYDTLEKQKDEGTKGSSGVPTNPTELDKLANKLVSALRQACELKNAKITGIALDITHKLMDYGYLRGAAVDEEDGKKLMPKVIAMISTCFDQSDDNVQLQIIKAFHTAVASPICDVHEASLLTAIRTCYNIFLVSRNQVNQTTAKATLTQMLHIIFSRMELQMSPDIVIGIDDTFEEDIDEQIKQIEGGNDGTPTKPRATREASVSDIRKELERQQQAEKIKERQQKEEEANTVEGFALQTIQGIIDKLTERPNETNGDTAAAEEARSAGHHVFTDCYLVFRALCKRSMKDPSKESAADMNSIDMRSKILSLDLILGILEGSGPVFKSCDKFINSAIKKYLIISLLTNGVSSNPRVFRLSLSIFLSLVSSFKDYLKTELGVFYTKIFLFILESGNSTIQQKWMVLQVLLQICKNPQALVDIFINYDCDIDSKDVYERIINDLSRIAHGRHTLGGDPSSEMKLKILGLECMVTIMRSLVDWSKDVRKQNESLSVLEETVDTNANGIATPKKAKSSEGAGLGDSVELGNTTPVRTPNKVQVGPDFNAARQTKILLSEGVRKFNSNPKKGMKFLIESSFVENTPDSVSRFLRNQENLDKAAIGDYLGEKDPFCISTLHSYVDAFSFENLAVDLALRKFLSPFRLPGEAQKIDRMMEKFAERYFSQHSNVGFANADSVYILAFSIIMLATDLHSPSIKNKMTKQIWIERQSKNNGGGDYDGKFLSEVFDRIAASPIKLQDQEDNDDDLGDLTSADPKTRRKKFQREMERTITKSAQVIKEKSKDKGTMYYRAKQTELVQPMFDIAWRPMLAAFSVLMEDSDDPEVYMLCLEGLRQNTTLSCTFNMDTERNAFVTTVTKFTFLQQSKEMKQKNIESIKTLMDVALTDGNYLHDSWLQILKCMSILEQLHLVGSGASTEAIPRFNSDDMRGSTGLSRNSASTRDLKRPVSMQVNYEMANAQMIAEHINAGAIDKIFSNSVNLNSTAIEEFTKALCQVSIEEISSANPRIFSLQKLVELAHFNMNRVRLVWSRVWNVLAAHFTKVGCDKSPHISMYAIDSLKQLAFKFLEKTELANYHFQKEFLKPFELIMANQSDVAIRDMVIRCLSNMVLARSHNIRSGWKSIFVVFTVAATDHDEAIVRLAFDMVQEINQKYFHMIADSFFVDCVNCLVAYGNGVIFIDVALKAIDSLSQCAKNLAEGKIVSVEAVSPTNPKVVFTENDRHLSLWFPVLTGLSGIVGHSHIDIRTSALRSLFTILETYGSMFNRNFWELMFRGVLLPIFDNVRYAGGADLLKEDNEWLTTTCLLALNSLIELFSAFFVDISFLLGEFLNLLVSCILQENESLARIGATCFLQLVMTNGTKFDEEMWTLVCTKLSHILENNSPVELTSHSSDFQKIVSDTPASPVIVEGTEDISSRSTMVTTAKGLRSKCTVQLGLIEALNEIAFTHYLSLTTDHLSALLDSLEKCYAFCRQVNHDPTIRIRIEKYGLVDLMLRKETTAVSCYLRVLFRMYGETQKDSAKRNQLAEARLFTKCSEIITDYMKRFGDSASVKVDNKKIITVYNHIIIQIIKGLLETYDEQLKKHTSSLYPLLCELILCDQSKDLRVTGKKTLGFINPLLYKDAVPQGRTYHDVTSGKNGGETAPVSTQSQDGANERTFQAHRKGRVELCKCCYCSVWFVLSSSCLVACPHLDPGSLVTISVHVNNRSSTGGQAGDEQLMILIVITNHENMLNNKADSFRLLGRQLPTFPHVDRPLPFLLRFTPADLWSANANRANRISSLPQQTQLQNSHVKATTQLIVHDSEETSRTITLQCMIMIFLRMNYETFQQMEIASEPEGLRSHLKKKMEDDTSRPAKRPGFSIHEVLEQTSRFPFGIVNRGRDSFIVAGLQSLLVNEQFMTWLYRIPNGMYHDEWKQYEQKGMVSQVHLTTELKKFATEFRGEGWSTAPARIPEGFWKALEGIDANQWDSSVFQRAVWAALSTTIHVAYPVNSFADSHQLTVETTFTCQNCGYLHKSETKESGIEAVCIKPKDVGPHENLDNAQAVLDNYWNMNGNYGTCNMCQSKKVVTRKEMKGDGPEVLQMYIQRFNVDQSTPGITKILHRVEMQDRLQIGNVSYRLQSIVLHAGKAAQGHYITEVNRGGRWYRIINETIHEIASKDVNGLAELQVSSAIYVKDVLQERQEEETSEQFRFGLLKTASGERKRRAEKKREAAKTAERDRKKNERCPWAQRAPRAHRPHNTAQRNNALSSCMTKPSSGSRLFIDQLIYRLICLLEKMFLTKSLKRRAEDETFVEAVHIDKRTEIEVNHLPHEAQPVESSQESPQPVRALPPRAEAVESGPSILSPIGISNRGFNCYAAAGLQSVLANDHFVAAVLHFPDGVKKEHFESFGQEHGETKRKQSQLLHELKKFILHIRQLEQERKATTHIPLEIWNALRAIRVDYNWNVQQDSSEIQSVMWEALDAVMPILNSGACFSQVHNVKVNTIFTCQICQGTHSKEDEEEKGLHMSCANGERGEFVPYMSVQKMVDHHFDVEGSYSRCESCKVNSVTRRRAMKGEGPDVLPIYLVRAVHDQYHRMIKLNHRIEVQERLWVGEVSYRLESLNFHIGERALSGHYMAEVKRGNRWYRINDHEVTEIDSDKVNREKHLQVSSAVYVKERMSEEDESSIEEVMACGLSMGYSLSRRCIVEVLASCEAKDMRDVVEKSKRRAEDETRNEDVHIDKRTETEESPQPVRALPPRAEAVESSPSILSPIRIVNGKFNCYAAAGLQSVLANDHFVAAVLHFPDGVKKEHFESFGQEHGETKRKQSQLLHELKKFILHIRQLEQERKATTHIPLEIWDALKAINRNYDWDVQQDSSEIQSVMWEALDAVMPILNSGTCFSQVHNVKVNTIFTCQICQGTHSREEEEEKGLHMSCAYGEKGMFMPYMSVQKMVDHHFDVEGSYSRCESCKVDSVTRRRAMKGEGPDVLPIYLKRTAHDQYHRVVKLNHRIEVQERLWVGEVSYRLESLNFHMEEGAPSGHYMAEVKRGNCWYRINNDKVTEIGPKDVNREKHLQVSSAVYVKERMSEEQESSIEEVMACGLSMGYSLSRRRIVEVFGSYKAKDMEDFVKQVNFRQSLRASQKINDDRKKKDIQRRVERQELKKNREVTGNAESQKVPPRPSKPRQSTCSRAEPQRVHRPTRMPDTLI